MRKSCALLCLAFVCLMLPLKALAVTLEEWNRSCWSKTGQAVTLYERDVIYPDSVNMDTGASNYTIEMREIGTLPANTYVKVSSKGEAAGYQLITYRRSDGSTASGYISLRPYPLVNASVYVQVVQSGFGIAVVKVNDTYLDDLPALRAYIQKNYPDCRLLEEEEKGNLEWGPGDSLHLPEDNAPNSSSSENSSASSGASKPSSTRNITPRKDYTGPHIKQLGLLTTIVRENGENSEVPTASLVLESVEAKYQLAVIHAPRTGKCTMREKPSKKSDMVKNCKAGRIAIVLEWGKEYTRILYNNAEGYVLTSCLKFYPTDVQTLGTGVLSWKGKATGRTEINIRSAPDKPSKKIGQWKTGTKVTVFTLKDGWYEIEFKGEHGYVLEEYLTLSE